LIRIDSSLSESGTIQIKGSVSFAVDFKSNLTIGIPAPSGDKTFQWTEPQACSSDWNFDLIATQGNSQKISLPLRPISNFNDQIWRFFTGNDKYDQLTNINSFELNFKTVGRDGDDCSVGCTQV